MYKGLETALIPHSHSRKACKYVWVSWQCVLLVFCQQQYFSQLDSFFANLVVFVPSFLPCNSCDTSFHNVLPPWWNVCTWHVRQLMWWCSFYITHFLPNSLYKSQRSAMLLLFPWCFELGNLHVQRLSLPVLCYKLKTCHSNSLHTHFAVWFFMFHLNFILYQSFTFHMTLLPSLPIWLRFDVYESGNLCEMKWNNDSRVLG